MSLVRSTYRQVLKRVHKASLIYGGPEKVCFSVFGIMLRMEDFTAAGCGDTPQQVVRSLFLRPGITGDAGDRVSIRLASGFDALRRLSEAVPVPPKTPYYAVKRQGEDTTPQSALSASASPSVREIKGGETLARMPGKHVKREVVTPASEDCDGDDGNDYDDDDEGVSLGEGTILVESSISHNLKKISRQVLVCKNPQQLSPYRYMIPPEPMHPKNTRVTFKFPLMREAMLCMAASTCASATATTSPFRSAAGQGPLVLGSSNITSEEYGLLCASIPIHTVSVTDHIEVRLRTDYVCSRKTDENGDVTGDEGYDTPDEDETDSTDSSTLDGDTKTEYIFRYFVSIRNYSPPRNKKKWHVQLLSRHLVFFNPESGLVLEVVGPGVGGNLPMLAPGESHTYESGASLCEPSGVMRGTFQLHAYNEEGQSCNIDVHIAPTRLVARPPRA
ncbi:hypothetical protein DQ04_02961010 [Trypanosoma grayi]|uniref:hypothetical protein n=1 Tax=Trypanosoma grayi TaxID=71804 RepID=UPI0004F4024D|nr:hypothetical protein DQ04_02961010 [Trypanosoma grayi]KEG11114.1 hypothetical protein DQ04_02961010 [Trypanosoma grayi]